VSPAASCLPPPIPAEGRLDVSGVGEAIVFLALAAVVAVIAVRLGMLLAPRLDRLTEPDDEDDGGEHD
jgi:hypothetical protein